MIHILKTEIGDVPCVVRLLNWEPYKPAYISGAPENCYEASGGHGDWEVWVDDERAKWLEDDMSAKDIEKLEDQLFYMMEGR